LVFVTGILSAPRDEYPTQSRVVAFADIHGDFQALVNVLQVAHVLSIRSPPPFGPSTFSWIRSRGNWSWIGGRTFVVQTGDQIDFGGRRTDSPDYSQEKEILEFLERLHDAAALQGGAVISLFGNHELMNMEADFRYSSKKGLADFGGATQRRTSWAPGSQFLSKLVATRPFVLKIGKAIFCHGGIEPQFARINISTINYLFQRWAMNYTLTNAQKTTLSGLMGTNGPLWSRIYSNNQPNCQSLMSSLSILNGNVMIVGHTPDLKIRNLCSSRLFALDTQMSRAFGLKRAKDTGEPRFWALEIINGTKVRSLNERSN